MSWSGSGRFRLLVGLPHVKLLTLLKGLGRLDHFFVSHLRKHDDLQPLLQKLLIHTDAYDVRAVGLAALALESVALNVDVRLLLVAQSLLDLGSAQVNGESDLFVSLALLVGEDTGWSIDDGIPPDPLALPLQLHVALD